MARVHFCGVREIFSVGLSNMAWVYQLAGTGRAAEEPRRGSSSNAADELDGPKSLADSVRRDRRIAARTSGTPGAGQKGAAAPRASWRNRQLVFISAPRLTSPRSSPAPLSWRRRWRRLTSSAPHRPLLPQNPCSSSLPAAAAPTGPNLRDAYPAARPSALMARWPCLGPPVPGRRRR